MCANHFHFKTGWDLIIPGCDWLSPDRQIDLPRPVTQVISNRCRHNATQHRQPNIVISFDLVSAVISTSPQGMAGFICCVRPYLCPRSAVSPASRHLISRSEKRNQQQLYLLYNRMITCVRHAPALRRHTVTSLAVLRYLYT